MMNDRLLRDEWYVLVSTDANPDGEMRAQLDFNLDMVTSAPTPEEPQFPISGW